MNLSQILSTKFPQIHKSYSGKYNNSVSATMILHPHQHSNKSSSINASDVALKHRIAYQGVPGAYGEAAAMKANPNCQTVECQQFRDTLEAVERGRAEEAVIPIENTIGGSIDGNYDLLLRYSLHVVGEIFISVDHCLLALPGVSKHHLTCVLSHPQALVQCEMSIKMLGVATKPTDNTAFAAQIVGSCGSREIGAIASARAAQLYGLHVLVHNFQDRSNNITRFLKLAQKPVVPTIDTPSKTTIAFIPKEGPQELYLALSLFAQSEIRISKIESRPLEKHSTIAVNGFKSGSNMYFKYVYFLDFEASVLDPRVQCALEHLQEMARYVRILGCYPMGTATS